MKISYRWKLGIVVTCVAVSLTSLCVYAVYRTAYREIMEQITKNMVHLGRLGGAMLDDEARAAIRRLDVASTQASIVTKAEIDAMPLQSTLSSLRQEDIDRLQATADFKKLVNSLVMIAAASYQDMEPPREIYTIDEPIKSLGEGGFGVLLATPIQESPDLLVLKYLVSCAPYPTEDGWPGNPIGNLAKNDHPQDFLLSGKSYTYDYVYSDEYYSSLDIVVPILNADGTPLAFLCIDYAAAKERNKLMILKYSCLAIVFISFLLAIAGSIYISRKLSRSLQQLTGAAERVAASDLDFVLDIQSKDEFATLGHTFNRMVRSIRGYTRDLAEKQQQLTTVVEDMHDGVGAILTGIVLSTDTTAEKKEDAAQAVSRVSTANRLAREGLAEVRFLMSALESDIFQFSTLIDEIRMQAFDILQPSGVTLDLQTEGVTEDVSISFPAFLEFQRIFREAFVNIVKHSDATICQVQLFIHNNMIDIVLQDNGSKDTSASQQNGTGHGLLSMKRRVEKMGGEFSFLFTEGFQLQIRVPSPNVILPPPEKIIT